VLLAVGFDEAGLPEQVHEVRGGVFVVAGTLVRMQYALRIRFLFEFYQDLPD
jgi:hypothetical protein